DIMQRKGGKPPHKLTEYFYILSEMANKSNRKCICRACMEAVGKEIALQDDSMKITNTKRYCANHLKDCPYFAAKFSSEQIQNILSLAVPSTSKKHSIMSFTKKQATLPQYIGRPLSASEVPKFERLILRATVSAGFAFRWTKELNVRANCLVTNSAGSYAAARRILRLKCVTRYDAASDDELKLPADVKAAINRDSFWNSLVALHEILHPFCGALDIMQLPERTNANEDITSEGDWDLVINEWEELLIDEELEEERDDLDDTEMDFLDTEIHPAENQAAKWKLYELFSPNLPFPFNI
ncbi:1320_t:CDS:2, partial [Gigaspora rosea]